MPRTIRPWLETFIDSELQAIISWARRSDESTDVKQEVEDRFTDDGSNFRSVAQLHHLPSQGQVQILAVLSESHPCTLLVSDGNVAVRARLSKDALNSLEAAIGESIDSDTTGDVFTITRVTVISTPYGVPDTHVQLDVESLVYDFHLRKTVGEPQPLGGLPNIQRLIRETTQIRNQQYSPEFDAVTPRVSSSAWVGGDGVEPEAEPDSPGPPDLRQAADTGTIHSSPPSQTSPRPQSQTALATQIAAPRRPGRRIDTPSTDHEPTSSLNWDRPTAPDMTVTQNYLGAGSGVLQRSAGPSSTSTILAERKTGSRIGQKAPSFYRETSSPRKFSADEAKARAVEDKAGESYANEVPSDLAGILGACGHRRNRNVPPDQQILLDQSSSWRPSLPGRQFPHPNIPIALLKEWNARASDSATNLGARLGDQSFGSRGERNLSMPKRNLYLTSRDRVDDDELVDVSESVGSDTSSDDEFAGMEWEPTPPSKGRLDDTRRGKLELPPDSSGDVPLPSQHGPSNRDSSPSALASNRSAAMDIEESSGTSESDSDSGGDMKLHVPRALDIDPFSVHRQRRRGKLRAAQRQKWIKAYYHEHESLASAYESYRRSYKNDQLAQAEFALAVQSCASSNALATSGEPDAKSDEESQIPVALYQQSVASPASDGEDQEDKAQIRGNPSPPRQPKFSAHPLKAESDSAGFAEGASRKAHLALSSGTYQDKALGGANPEYTSAGLSPCNNLLPQSHRTFSTPKTSTPSSRSPKGAANESPLPPKEGPKMLVASGTEATIYADLASNEERSHERSASTKNLSSPHVYRSQNSDKPAPSMAVPQSSVLVRPEQVRSASIIVPATPEVIPQSTAVRTNGQGRQQDTRTLEIGGMSGVFGDFAQAVGQLKPSGAFASVDGPKRPIRRAIRVLDWEL